MTDKVYDLIIIGGGPAGYTAALYSSRAGLDTLLLEKFSAGGQMTQTSAIDNYPGFDESIDGFTLGDKMKLSAEKYGAKTVRAEVLKADLTSNPKKLYTDSGEFFCLSVIIATGAEHKHLGLPDEESLIGKGVAYCASCDGMMYRGKTVAVVGGGNSAVSDALLLSKICKKVYLIHRRDTLRAEKIYEVPLMKAENVEFKWNSIVTEFLYERTLKGVKLKNKLKETEEILELDGIFISIGRTPNTEIFKEQLNLDQKGYIIATEDTRTNLDGVFAAGDIRTKPFRQIVTAAADGAVAAHLAEEFLEL